jgi:hypothetical protein
MQNKALKAYPGCPSFSWVVAKRVTNSHEVADCFITCYGRKGAGKSTLSVALCEDIAKCVSSIRGRGEPPTKFFNIDHIVSVTKEGAIKLLTSGILKQKNSILLLDDVSLQWNSRNFATWINKSLNDILTIARVFSCVVVANCVQASHLDVVARQMCDYKIMMVSKNTRTGQSVFKVYFTEAGTDGTEYKRFLTWHGKRVKYWIGGRPSTELESAYTKMRQENTIEHIENSYKKMNEKLGIDDGEPKPDGRVRVYEKMPMVVKHRDRVRAMFNKGMKINAISREVGITRYWVERCLSGGDNDAQAIAAAN